jgi:hypothetical protein
MKGQPTDGICPAHREPEPCQPCANLASPYNDEDAEDYLPPFVADPLDPAERIPLSPEEQARAGAAIERYRERTGR